MNQFAIYVFLDFIRHIKLYFFKIAAWCLMCSSMKVEMK